MKNSGEVIPEGIYPVKGVTVKDNQISGYGNGISITLADTDTVMDNQVKMKKTSAYSNLGIYAEGFPEEALSKGIRFPELQIQEFI